MTTPIRLVCCRPPCPDEAEFELRDGPSPDDYTHACRQHVRELLADDKQTTITPLLLEPHR
jgi:hypothetical protein